MKRNLKMDKNQKQRLEFIDKWAEYVRMHSDKDWSSQQNVLINSCLKTANMTKEQFLEMKKVGKDEMRLWKSRKNAEELGVFDEAKRIHKMLRKKSKSGSH